MLNIKLKNWDKYNKRQKDIVRPFWYAMSNRFFYDPDFMDFSNEEKLTFFFILGEASQQNKYGEVLLNETLYSRITGFNKRTLFNTVDKLLILGAAAGWRQDGGRNATATEQNRTEHNNNTSVPDCTGKPMLDFETLYKKYPRKKGKTDGMEVLANTIKSDQDYQLLSTAIDNYNLYLKNNQDGVEFTKYFSTFVGTKSKQQWREWLDPEVYGEIKTNAGKKIIGKEKLNFGDDDAS